MGYSNDLRVRVIQVVESGVAARAAARQFVIGDFDGDPLGEAVAGDRQRRGQIEQGAEPVAAQTPRAMAA